MKVEKNNEKMAQFIGACQVYKPYVNLELYEYDMYGIIETIEDGEDEKHYFLPDEMLFNISWDWLMVVVNKIEELGNDVIIGTDFIKITFDEGEDFILIDNVNVKLEALYNACSEFIEIYEENKLSK